MRNDREQKNVLTSGLRLVIRVYIRKLIALHLIFFQGQYQKGNSE